MNNLEFIKSKISYPLVIYHNKTYNQDANDTQIQKLINSKLIVIGDLHGNIKKALEILIVSDIVALDILDLILFFDLFLDVNFGNDEIIVKLCNIIKSIKLSNNKKVIFLGDILADRVGNDVLGLCFVNQLALIGLDFKILIGNHDHACNFEDLGAAKYMKDCCESFFLAFNIYDSGDFESKKEIELNLQKFLQKSKLLEFDKQNKTLFVHAGITKRNIKSFLKLFISLGILKRGYELSETTFENFCIIANQFYTDYRLGKYEAKKYVIENKVLANIHSRNERLLEGFLWVGEHDYLDSFEFFKSLGVETIVHGHDDYDRNSIFSPMNNGYKSNSDFTVINLDNSQGKSLESSIDTLPLYIA